MLTALVLASSLANATDVARTRKFGIGASTGVAYLAFTGKYYFDPKGGIAFWAGTSGIHHQARVNYEREFVEFADWDFARFDMYWDVGADFGVWYLGTAEVGAGGGVGVELQFHEVPVQVWVDAGAGVYPSCYGYGVYVGGCFLQGRGSAGGRWYF
ncbi:MAG: hypothetical protein ACOZNI_17920 [Myxococcota bacterium]